MFLVFGIYLCYRVRAAPSEYSEGTYVSAAICYECFISTVFYILRSVLKPVLSGHSKIDKTKVLKTNGCLMKVESIAECSPWSILQYFDLH